MWLEVTLTRKLSADMCTAPRTVQYNLFGPYPYLLSSAEMKTISLVSLCHYSYCLLNLYKHLYTMQTDWTVFDHWLQFMCEGFSEHLMPGKENINSIKFLCIFQRNVSPLNPMHLFQLRCTCLVEVTMLHLQKLITIIKTLTMKNEERVFLLKASISSERSLALMKGQRSKRQLLLASHSG